MTERAEPRGAHQLDVEQVDLAELRDVLRPHEAELLGSLDGRSQMRDIIAAHLDCSLLEAENLVDTLVARGFARLRRDLEGRERWRIATGT